jgi:hypothetical protein
MTFLALSDRYLTAKVQSKSIGKFIRSSGVILAMSVSIYEIVKAALKKDDRQYLKDIEADLKKRIDGVPKRSIEDLLGAVNNTSFFLARNFGAESYIPKYVREKTKKICTALR